MNFIPEIIPPNNDNEESLWFLFYNRNFVIKEDKHKPCIPCKNDIHTLQEKIINKHYIGLLNGIHCYAALIDSSMELPHHLKAYNLYLLINMLEEDILRVCFRAAHIINWDTSNNFCNRCGASTEKKIDERAKKCPACGYISYPRISPAILAAVIRESDGSILLANARRMPAGLYSVIAGFVEAGETLEECVHREVMEETGLKIKNITYYESRPWPFPDSLMITFTALYAGGEIKIDENELIDARWFKFDNLPQIPFNGTPGRRIIDQIIMMHKT